MQKEYIIDTRSPDARQDYRWTGEIQTDRPQVTVWDDLASLATIWHSPYEWHSKDCHGYAGPAFFIDSHINCTNHNWIQYEGVKDVPLAMLNDPDKIMRLGRTYLSLEFVRDELESLFKTDYQVIVCADCNSVFYKLKDANDSEKLINSLVKAYGHTRNLQDTPF